MGGVAYIWQGPSQIPRPTICLYMSTYIYMSGEGVEEGDFTCACHDQDYYNFTADEDYYTLGR